MLERIPSAQYVRWQPARVSVTQLPAPRGVTATHDAVHAF
jgi:hypothetical protein